MVQVSMIQVFLSKVQVSKDSSFFSMVYEDLIVVASIFFSSSNKPLGKMKSNEVYAMKNAQRHPDNLCQLYNP
jgi:hypothetical protein